MPPQPYLQRIMEHRATLTRNQAHDLMQQIFHDEWSDLALSALLGALSARGETPAELAGCVDAMRSAVTPIPLTPDERLQLTDTCGTGGDASGTFNISTAAALVAAAAGATVAKHGNRAVTSRCGSADVLEALGIPVLLSPDDAAAALRRHRFAFLHAPSLHPAMKTVLPVRRALGIRTVFNLLGPLTNPAGASAQVMGVYAPHLVPLVAEAMALLGTRHAFVVHGEADGHSETDRHDKTGGFPNEANSLTGEASSLHSEAGGLDELSLSGASQLAEVRTLPNTAPTITLSTITPEQFGLTRAPLTALAGGDAATNAAILRAIFRGQSGPHRDVVLLNAAAVLVTAGLAPDLPAAILRAAQTIDAGKVTELLTYLARTS